MSALDYTNVVRWLNSHGDLAHLCLAQRKFPEAVALDIAREIVGPKVHIQAKRIRGSWAWGTRAIYLSCDSQRRIKLDSVLHECAHVLNDRKPRKMRGTSHGEPFRRTYARLLRTYTVSAV